MKAALLADLHGNRDALAAVEAQLTKIQPDEIWFLGDAVGKGPDNDECLDWVLSHCSRCIAGNWDQGVGMRLFARDGLYQRQLGEERLQKLCAWPVEQTVEISGLRLRLMHGRPVMPELLIGIEAGAELQHLFTDASGKRCDAVVYADMHRQLIRTLSMGTLYNIGSVGNATGIRGAFFAVLEGEAGNPPAPFSLQFCRVPYDVEPVIERAQRFFGETDKRYTSFAHELRTGEYVPRAPNVPMKRF